MSLPQSAGVYFSGPDLRFGATANEEHRPDARQPAGGLRRDLRRAALGAVLGPCLRRRNPAACEAIGAASKVEDGTLVIDRAGVRQYLNAVNGYRGIIGTINCDSFGDCGSQKITVIHHLDPGDIEASLANVVFEFAP